MNLQIFLNKLAPFNPDEKLVFASDLSIEECSRRLHDHVDKDDVRFFSLLGSPPGSKPVVGFIEGSEFFLRKRLMLRNDFAPRFCGILIPRDRGTEIVGYFDSDPSTKGFMRLWLGVIFGFALLMPLAFVLEDKVQGVEVTGGPVVLLVPLAMIGLGILLPRAMRAILKDQEEYLLGFLESTLVAIRESGEASYELRTGSNR